MSTDISAPPATEVPHTLEEPTPRPLGVLDQAGLWGNLGVTLLGFGGAVAITFPAGAPRLPLAGAFAAAAVGTLLGTLALSLSTLPGAQTGAPAMVLLRGVFGGRLSWVPTVLNIVQCLGWGTFELVVIADGAVAVTGHHVPRWGFVVLAGLITTGLSLRPLGYIRLLRRYITVIVAIALVYLAVQFARHPLPQVHGTSWRGFGAACDVAIAVAVSWVPLSSDYSRHSRSPRAAFLGSFGGYAVTQFACYSIGLLALALVAESPDRVFGAFLAVPLGALFLAILVVREIDESFANVYSTAVSVQNLRPRADRRVLASVVGVLCTAMALLVNINRYESFLYLIGSVFVPLFGVLAVDYFAFGGRRSWNLDTAAPPRPAMLIPWVVGFVVYQLVNPGGLVGWVEMWQAVDRDIGLTPEPWMSASVLSFLAAAAGTAVVNLVRRRAGGSRVSQPGSRA
jgi:putative hydroxymethylpyrimidine transporter CytX